MADDGKQRQNFVSAVFNKIKPYKEVATDAGDIALKTVSDSEALKDVPLVKWAVAAYSIRDHYQYKRLKRNAETFLSVFESASAENAENLRQQLFEDPKFAENFQDVVEEIIIEASRPIKAELLGNLVKNLAEKNIDRNTFDTLGQVIHSCSIPGLNAVATFAAGNGGLSYKTNYGELDNEGLIASTGLSRRDGNMFRLTGNGIALCRYGFLINISQ